MPRNREEIRNDIEYRISADIRLADGSVKVEVNDGRVVLSGQVPTYWAKDAIEQDVWAVKGVSYLENRLAVVFPEQYRHPGDEAIKDNLQRLISVDPDLYQENIGIHVANGKVSLEGTVGNYFRKVHAEHLARVVGGVGDISNKLAVVPTRSISDQTIGSTIEDHLHRLLSNDANSIVLEIQNGRVVLAGLVPDRRAFDTVEDIARYTHGVTDVENHMAIAA